MDRSFIPTWLHRRERPRKLWPLLVILGLLAAEAIVPARVARMGWGYAYLAIGAVLLLLLGTQIHASLLLLLCYGPFASFLRFRGLSNVQALFKDVFVIGVFSLWMARVLMRRAEIKRSPLDAPLWSFLVLAGVQLLQAPSLLRGLLGLKILATYVTVYFLLWNNPPSKRFLRLTLWAVSLVGVVTALYGFYQYFIGVPTTIEIAGELRRVSTRFGAVRIFSTFPHSAVFSLYVVMLVAVSLGFLRVLKGFKRWLMLGTLLLLMSNLPYTLTRVGWITILLALLALLILASDVRERWSVLLLGLLGAVLFVTLATGATRQTVSWSFGEEDTSFQHRMIFLQGTFRMMLQHPQGFGLGSLADAGARLARVTGDTAQREMLYWRGLPVQSADTVALGIGMQMGLPGYLIYVWLFISIWHHGLRNYRRVRDPFLKSLGAGILGFLAAMTFSNFLAGSAEAFPVVDLYFWYWVGILMVLPQIEERERSQESAAVENSAGQ